MRVFVQSFGCSTNQADGAVLAGCLARAGYKLTNSISVADVIVYNTCAVKTPTENRMIELCKHVPKEKKLIVAGCLPLINSARLQREVRFEGIAGPAAGDSIVEVVERVLNGQQVLALDDRLDRKPNLLLPQVQRNSVVSAIPVNYGCLGSCTYCCVVFARGRLRSYKIEEIVKRVEKDVDKGFRELWLTSQDTACYGKDIGTNLAELLSSVCAVPGGFKLRVGMMTPNLVLDMLEDLVDVFRDGKIFKFVHLPVQSGDNGVLRRMRRFYSIDDFKKVVYRFRNVFKDLTLATDIICGFPGEKKKAFERTLSLIEEVKPDVINVSKFFARPNTRAAGMRGDFVSSSEIRRRSGMAASLVKTLTYEKNKRWVGWSGEVLVDEAGKVPHSWVGRNFAYKPITVMSSNNLLGRTLTVKIEKAFPTYLEGKTVE